MDKLEVHVGFVERGDTPYVVNYFTQGDAPPLLASNTGVRAGRRKGMSMVSYGEMLKQLARDLRGYDGEVEPVFSSDLSQEAQEGIEVVLQLISERNFMIKELGCYKGVPASV